LSAIHDLIKQIDDPRLRERLTAEWAQAAHNRKFGLVFEDHLPELLPLHHARPRKGKRSINVKPKIKGCPTPPCQNDLLHLLPRD
jgi:hypothetical protein